MVHLNNVLCLEGEIDLISVKYQLSVRTCYRHPCLRQVLWEIMDPFTDLNQKPTLKLEGK